MTLIFGCFIWIPICAFSVFLVHWMIGQDIDLITGIVGLMVLIGLGVTAIKPPIPIASPLSFVAVIVSGVSLPFLRAAMDRRELRSIDIDGIHRAYDALAARPGNPMAIIKLAKHVYQVGFIGHAVALADSVMPQLPKTHFREEHRMLERWKRAGVPPATLSPMSCVDCSTSCTAGQTHCSNCGARFLHDRAKGRVLGHGMAPKLLAVWLALLGCLAGIPAASTLTPEMAIPAICGIMIAAVAFIFFAFKKPRGAASL